MTTPGPALTRAQRFFYDNSGYSYAPAHETREAGQLRCARELAAAEERAHALEWELRLTMTGETFAWQGQDFAATHRAADGETLTGFDAAVIDQDGRVRAALGAVTFAGNDTRDPYARVIFAQPAAQALDDIYEPGVSDAYRQSTYPSSRGS
jgi:hypothetical protein